MQLTCSGCRHLFSIEDAKVPQGTFKIRCPKCGKIITAQKEAENSSPPEQAVSSATEAYIKQELSKLKNEILDAVGQQSGKVIQRETAASGITSSPATGNMALLCESEQVYIESVSGTLAKLGYSVDVARGTSEAIKKVDANPYSLILIDSNLPDDKEGWRKIVDRVNGQKPAIRRQTFVALLSDTAKSGDGGAAFFSGVNLTVNRAEVGNLSNLLREGQRYFQEFYQLFHHLIEEKNLRV